MLRRGVRIEPLWSGVHVDGRPLAHGKVLAFEPGTDTPKPLWKSSDQTVPWHGPDGNQVDLDEHGKALAYGHGLIELCVCSPSLALLERWEPVFFGHTVVSAKDFGAVGAGEGSIGEDTAALQSAIDYAARNGAKLFIPAGTYMLTDTLRVYKLAQNPDAPLSTQRGSSPFDRRVFTPFRLEIVGERSSVGVLRKETVLIATMSDRPAVVVQGAGSLDLRRLTITGAYDPQIGDDPADLLDDRAFAPGRCRDGDNTKPASPTNAICSPYAAIAIDPFRSGGPPADGGYPGSDDDYFRNALSSASVSIEQVIIKGFVAGVVIAPSGASASPESVTIADTEFDRTRIAVAIGSGRSFVTRLRNVRSSRGQIFVSTCSFGDAAPSAELPTIEGASVSRTKYLFFANAPDPGATVEGLSCEATLSIGFLESGYGSAAPSVTFVGSSLHFAAVAPAIDTHLASTAGVRFVSCSFASEPPPSRASRGEDDPLPIRFFNAGPLAFASCTFLNTMGAGDPTSCVSFEALDKVTFEECQVGDRSSPNQLVVLDRVHTTAKLSSLNRSYVLPGSLIIAADMSGAPLQVSAEVKDIVVRDVLVKRDFDTPGGATFFAPDPHILKPGDRVFALDPGWVPEHYGQPRRSRGLCGVIRSIEGSMVRLGSVVKSFSFGHHDLVIKYLPRLHLASTGVTTEGSDRVYEVTNPETWHAYDRISGAGIPEGAYVIEPAPPGGNVLRISKGAIATGRTRLFDADVSRFSEPRGTYMRPRLDTLTGAEIPPSSRRPT